MGRNCGCTCDLCVEALRLQAQSLESACIWMQNYVVPASWSATPPGACCRVYALAADGTFDSFLAVTLRAPAEMAQHIKASLPELTVLGRHAAGVCALRHLG